MTENEVVVDFLKGPDDIFLYEPVRRRMVYALVARRRITMICGDEPVLQQATEELKSNHFHVDYEDFDEIFMEADYYDFDTEITVVCHETAYGRMVNPTLDDFLNEMEKF